MYTYNNMLYKHNKTHFSDFEKVLEFSSHYQFSSQLLFLSSIHYLSHFKVLLEAGNTLWIRYRMHTIHSYTLEPPADFNSCFGLWEET